ncbi:MAG: VUT family protein, partial [Rhodospirillales bacterium]|nr:VUT family protein [Rhodospirillales bacterium]
LAAILGGAALSGLVAPAALAMASVLAFFVSELADFAVYTPLQRRRFIGAVIGSSLIGLSVDSVLFLWLAFGSLEFLWGQLIGKAWMLVLALPFIYWIKAREDHAATQAT